MDSNVRMIRLLIAVGFTVLGITSCSKKEGCREVNALNYDSTAETDGNCNYTKALFYAPSNRISGNPNDVVKIEIYLGPTPGEQLIGTINTFNHVEPINCSIPQGAFQYELPGPGTGYVFITRYYYDDNTDESGDTHLIDADRNKSCQTVQLTL